MPTSPPIHTIETPSLGNRSYVVVGKGEAIVIDPPRDLDRVQAVLDEVGARAVLVVETHRHADYLTGGLTLARQSRARYAVAADPELVFDHVPVHDGDVLEAAGFELRALHTPGHTPHHISYALSQHGQEIAVFTGGSLLYGAVGRTDLVDPELTAKLSADQYHSAHRLAAELPDDTLIYPTHGFGSFCSAGASTETDSSTIAAERRTNAALTANSVEDFVAELLTGYDAYTAYYAHMPVLNAAGPGPIDLSPPVLVDAGGLRRALEDGSWVVDLRTRAAYADGHLAGTFSFGIEGNMAVYLGWLIPWGTPVVLLGESADQVADAQRELARIGIDRPVGAAFGSPTDWADSPGRERSFRRVDFTDLAAERQRRADLVVLDVRRNLEWSQSHLPGAVHIPLQELQARLDDVPDADEVWVHCGTGYRAAASAALLEQAGRRVVLIDDAYADAESKGNPLVRPDEQNNR